MKHSPPQSPPPTADLLCGWLASLAFWGCLLAAAGLYALSVLAPKWEAHHRRRAEHDRNQRQLVALERDVDRLERIIAALAGDPEFAEQLARIDFHAAGPGEELIPLEGELTLSLQRLQLPRAAEPAPAEALPAWVARYAHPAARHRALATAAALVLVGFICFPVPSGGGEDGEEGLSVLGRLYRRYRRP